ncbi:MAG: family 20 glycosylhydrolase [Planifilum sp.]
MRLCFKGDLSGLEVGLRELETDLSFVRDEEGFPVEVERVSENRLQVQLKEKKGRIRYREPIHFYRGLGILIDALREGKAATVTEEPRFAMNGAMFDCSRNAVFRPEILRRVIRMMALMGLNVLMLYTEDTYTVEGEPYFGYMRGRYTPEELKELDEYASHFGIEMIPCIQTLAHLAAFLKWEPAGSYRDTEDVLLAASEDTYRLIERMIRSVSETFRSRRIHIGMDEAFGLGRGKYLDRYGYRPPFEIMMDHLGKVLEITSRYGLKPMMWSDMFFRMASPGHEYYNLDAEIPEEVIRRMPRGVQLVYWDYYHDDPAFYEQFIDKHRSLRSDPVFAGGVWTWSGPAIHYEKTFATTNAALAACKRKGIREVFATFWGDDGAETNMLAGLLGLQLFAEHGYAEEPDPETLKRRFALCTGGNADAFYNMGKFDTFPGADKTALIPDNPSKFLLWQDVLIGLFDKQMEGKGAAEHFERLHRILKEDRDRHGRWQELFEVPVRLSEVLHLKCEIGLRIKEHYDRGERGQLETIARQELPKLYQAIDGLRKAHRKQWLSTYKPFGWEVLDIRYGGLLARVETAMERLRAFCDGEISRIEELEEERLGFDGFRPGQDPGVGKANLYSRIATACVMGFR